MTSAHAALGNLCWGGEGGAGVVGGVWVSAVDVAGERGALVVDPSRKPAHAEEPFYKIPKHALHSWLLIPNRSGLTAA